MTPADQHYNAENGCLRRPPGSDYGLLYREGQSLVSAELGIVISLFAVLGVMRYRRNGVAWWRSPVTWMFAAFALAFFAHGWYDLWTWSIQWSWVVGIRAEWDPRRLLYAGFISQALYSAAAVMIVRGMSPPSWRWWGVIVTGIVLAASLAAVHLPFNLNLAPPV